MDLYYSQKTWDRYKNILYKHSSLGLKDYMSKSDVTFNNLIKQLDILLFSNSPYKFYTHNVNAIHILNYELSINADIESSSKYESIVFVAPENERLVNSKSGKIKKVLSENAFNKVLDIINEFLNSISDKVKTVNNTIDPDKIEEILLTYLDRKIYKFDFDKETNNKINIIFSYKKPQKNYEKFGYVGSLAISADKFGYYLIKVATPLCGEAEYKIKSDKIEEELVNVLKFLKIIKK